MTYYCVLDFEATCIENKVIHNQEIIQFPSVLYKYSNSKLEYLGEFNEYVRPSINPKLSEFCKNLTGIQQETIDNADFFKSVFKRHFLWLSDHVSDGNVVFITVGNWDLEIMLPKQLKLLNMKNNKKYTKWINIKESYKKFYNYKPSGLLDMLTHLEMKFIGKQHNGLDDTRNTARIFEQMIKDGCVFALE